MKKKRVRTHVTTKARRASFLTVVVVMAAPILFRYTVDKKSKIRVSFRLFDGGEFCCFVVLFEENVELGLLRHKVL